jgi:hypothetical protein
MPLDSMPLDSMPLDSMPPGQQNMYVTGIEGPDMPYDLHPIIWGYVGEAERAERYRARELRFRFLGYIALEDREAMLRNIDEWFRLERDMLEVGAPSQMRQILNRLQTWLTAWFHVLFQTDTQDNVNLPAQAFSQKDFHITSLRRESLRDGGGHGPFTAIVARRSVPNADGVHRIRLQFTRLPVGGPYTSVNIQYIGPQRFTTFDNRDVSQARGGTLEELDSGPPAVGRPRDDHTDFEGWM